MVQRPIRSGALECFIAERSNLNGGAVNHGKQRNNCPSAARSATEAAAQLSVKRDRLRPTSRSHRVRREERQSRRNPETAVDRQRT